METEGISSPSSAKRQRLSELSTTTKLYNENLKMEDINDEEIELDDDANYEWSDESDPEGTGNEDDVIDECLSDSGGSSDSHIDQIYEIIVQNNGWDESDKEIEFDDDDDEWNESDLENGDNEDDVMIGEYLLNSRDIIGDNKQNVSESAVRSKPNWISLPKEPLALKKIPFTGNTCVMVPYPAIPKAIDFFYMLATDEFFDSIIRETNIYAKSASLVAWEDLTKKELCIFLGLVLHMGNIRLTRTKDYWAKRRLFNIPCFNEAMTRKRFVSIMTYLQFARNPEPDEYIPDKLYKIRPLIIFFNTRMQKIYYPTKELIIDESMILWRNRLMFRQYTRNKENKIAIKMYSLRDAKGMVIKFSIYTAAIDDMGKSNHAAEVVLDLLEGKLNAGHSVYMDQYYNSYDLSCKLLEQNTYSSGILRSGRRGNPQEVVEAQLDVGKSISRFSNGVLIGKWAGGNGMGGIREVLYISTEHNDKMDMTKNKYNQEESKPQIILEHNQLKSEVDSKDQMVSHYHSTRRKLEWHKKIGIHVIELMVVNAFKLFCLSTACPDKMGFHEFRMSIINELVPVLKTVTKKQIRKKIDKTVPHFIARYGKSDKGKQMRKRCRHCSKLSKRSDSMFYCKTCPDLPGLCAECFEPYHK